MSATDRAEAHVVVSPHPDDAVWSLGGRLARWVARGVPVTVVTVFDGPVTAGARGGGMPDAAHGPDAWRSVARPALRRREDRAALTLLGAAHVSLGFTDAALRTSHERYRYSCAPRVRGPRHADDARLADELGAALRTCCPAGARVHGPLAAGRHVDHVLVREAVERLGQPDTAWYEDFPYPLRRRDHAGMAVGFAPLTPAEIETWLAGAVEYASQARALFGGTAELRGGLLARARAHGTAARVPYAERFWLRSAHAAPDAGHRPPGEPPPPPDENRARAPSDDRERNPSCPPTPHYR